MQTTSPSRWDVPQSQRATIDRAVERDSMVSATCLARGDRSETTVVEIGSRGKRIGTAQLVWQKATGTYRLGDADKDVVAWVIQNPTDRQPELEQAVGLDMFTVDSSLYGLQPEWVDENLYNSVSYVD